MIGAIFNGPVEQINYFPQPHSINASGGDWYKMEQNEWKVQTNNGQSVQVDIQPQFQGNSKRPYQFNVQYWYNGVQQTDSDNIVPTIFVKPNP